MAGAAGRLCRETQAAWPPCGTPLLHTVALSVNDAAACPSSTAGVPAYNKTFFCDGTATKCYSLRTGSFSYDTQRAQCQQFGGDMVFYESLAEQVEVDGYFQTKNREGPAGGSCCMQHQGICPFLHHQPLSRQQNNCITRRTKRYQLSLCFCRPSRLSAAIPARCMTNQSCEPPRPSSCRRYIPLLDRGEEGH